MDLPKVQREELFKDYSQKSLACSSALQKSYLWSSKLSFFKGIEDLEKYSCKQNESEAQNTKKTHIFNKDVGKWRIHLFKLFSSGTSTGNFVLSSCLFTESDSSDDDDEDVGGTSTIGASESEDNWDELSEMMVDSDDEDRNRNNQSEHL